MSLCVATDRTHNQLGPLVRAVVTQRLASLPLYNCEEVDVLVTALRQLTASPPKGYR